MDPSYAKTRQLYKAVSMRNWDKANLLIAQGAVPDTATLNEAIYAGNSPSAQWVKLLLDAGAQPTATTLHGAVEHRESETADLLIAAGVVPAAQTLTYAVDHLDAAWVKKLLGAGAPPTQEALYASILSNRISRDTAVTKILLDAGVAPGEEAINRAKVWWGNQRTNELFNLVAAPKEGEIILRKRARPRIIIGM